MAIAVSPDQPQYACCGQHFCESCLEHWFRKQGREVCPHCREENFNHFLDKPVKHEIGGFKIHCINRKIGCSWIGELSSLKPHLESEKGCGYVEVHCSKNCDKKLKRKDLADHLNHHCPLRKYKCQHCGEEDTYQAITEKHYDKCPNYPLDCPNECGTEGIRRAKMGQHRSTCPLEPVKCPFQETGCQVTLVRKDFDGHMEASNQQHLLLVMTAFQTLKEETKAELRFVKQGISTVVGHLLQSCSRSQVAPLQSIQSLMSYRLRNVGDQITFAIPSADQYRRNGKTWQSPPFYYMEGYKMRLDVSLDEHILFEFKVSGFDTVKVRGVQCSYYLYLLKGEFDDELPWPITDMNTIKLVAKLHSVPQGVFGDFVDLGVLDTHTTTISPPTYTYTSAEGL